MGCSKIDKLIDILKSKDLECATKGFAGMSYNASIARILEKGGVGKFEELAWDGIQELGKIATMKDFDTFHDVFVDKVLEAIKTNKGEKLSYGDAQKPVNVFLKEYVYRAKLPEQQLAMRLVPYLHVPLDKNMMEFFYEEFPTEYKACVHPVIAQYQEYAEEKGHSLRLRDREFLNLAHLWSKGQYYAWQTLFRNLYPDCPLLLDNVYALKSGGIPIELCWRHLPPVLISYWTDNEPNLHRSSDFPPTPGAVLLFRTKFL